MIGLETAIGRRKFIIAMALRRAKAGSGSTVAFLRRRTWSEPTVDLHRLRTPFVIVGAVATWLYAPQRATQDIDILVAPADAPRLHAELSAAGCTLEQRLAFGGTGWLTPDGTGLDVLESHAPWLPDAIAHPNRSPTGLPVISLPYLVLMKLEASRSIDVGDLTRMLGQADEALRDQVRAVVRTYRHEDAEDVESLMILGDIEFEIDRRPGSQ
jgi:hypothetical protein